MNINSWMLMFELIKNVQNKKRIDMLKHLMMFILAFTLLSCSASFFTQIKNINESNDITYGYTADNPIRIGYSNPEGSIDYTYDFISNLRDSSNNPLNLVLRFSTADPDYELSLRDKIPKRFGNSISGGILDCFVLTKNNDRDTVKLYFDIYDDKPLYVPKGLKFVK